MNPRRLLLTLLPVLLTAVAGVQVWRMNLSGTDSTAEIVLPETKLKPKPKTASAPVPMGQRQFSGKQAPETTAEPASDGSGGIPSSQTPAHPTAAASSLPFQPISEQELQRRAARVEQEANHDLKQLVTLLDLNETQQDRIFDSMVRHAPGWHPAMQTVGVSVPATSTAKTPGTSGSSNTTSTAAPGTSAGFNPAASPVLLDEIAAVLEPDQQIELANSELDRQEWWEEIIPQLLVSSETPLLDVSAGTAAAAAPPPPVDQTPADSKTAEDPGVLAE